MRTTYARRRAARTTYARRRAARTAYARRRASGTRDVLHRASDIAYAPRPEARTTYARRPARHRAYAPRPAGCGAYAPRRGARTAYARRRAVPKAYARRRAACRAYAHRRASRRAFAHRHGQGVQLRGDADRLDAVVPHQPWWRPFLTLQRWTVLTGNGHPALGGHFTEEVRRCPTLPQGPPCSTIGAVRLSFRVRNVTGRFPHAMAAETLLMFQSAQQKRLSCGSRPYIENHSVDASTKTVCYQVIGLLVPVSFTRYRASTSGLSTQ